MTRFGGMIGYGTQVETKPGVWKDVITERKLYGDVLTNTKQHSDEGGLNGTLSVSNQISVVADAYATAHFFAIRYVKWVGVRWRVSKVDVLSPRLILTLGEVYNGPTPS